jgi:hypothetical protein
MKWVWAWGGTFFGYIDGKDLWTHDGKHIGKLQEDEIIYGPDGHYLGELMKGERLIINRSKKGTRSSGFAPYGQRVGYVRQVNYVGYVMLVGYEDFPGPEAF